MGYTKTKKFCCWFGIPDLTRRSVFYLATLPRAKASAQPCERNWAWGLGRYHQQETGCTEQRLGSLSPSGVETWRKQAFQSPGPFTRSPQSKDGAGCGLQFLKNCSHTCREGGLGDGGGRGKGRRPGVLRYRRLVVHCIVWASRSQPGLCSRGSWHEARAEQSPCWP